MTRRFHVTATPLPGVHLVQRRVFADERGFLSRLFCSRELQVAGWPERIAQINHTLTRSRGTVRGLHFQRPPHSEYKLVTCLRGQVWDVAVDVRADSPTFLHWYAHELSSENTCAMLIPEGFAHGFQTLTDNCELLYVHSSEYAPDAETGINVRDARVNVTWPLPIANLSERDENLPGAADAFAGACP